jgi:hypothetical protein
MQVALPAKPKTTGSLALPIAFALWLLLACTGMTALWIYSVAPGKSGTPPDRWPESSSLQRAPGASTLVMFVHPNCPCSRASISELAVLLAHSAGQLHAQVIFLKPPGEEDSWTHTDLWRAASQLPGTAVISDAEGREAELFRVTISGETLLYDASGNLRFHGGITGARGHSGENAGCSAVQSYANTGTIPLARTPVFGCPLFDDSTSRIP